MTCRRKTKTERELVADIKKAFTKYCDSVGECRDCDYYDKLGCSLEDCIVSYLKELAVKTAKNMVEEKEEK